MILLPAKRSSNTHSALSGAGASVMDGRGPSQPPRVLPE